MICKLCGSAKSLVKSHIIPESFFRELRKVPGNIKIIPTNKAEHSKKAPIGIYDMRILCIDCEKAFGDADFYADVVLNKTQELKELRNHTGRIGFIIENIQHDRLKRFVITLLWRASVSSMPFFRNVKLGPLENYAKQLILQASTGNADDFSFVLASFNPTDPRSKIIFDPHSEKWYGRNYYRFYLGGYVLYVKADSQSTPAEWASLIPQDNNLIIIDRGDFQQSHEFGIFLKGVDPHPAEPRVTKAIEPIDAKLIPLAPNRP